MSVDSLKILVYTLAGLTFAIAGIMSAVQTQSAYPLAGTGLEFEAICAAVVGGYSFSGGEGTVVGGIAGAAVLSVILNIMVLTNVSSYWQYVVEGIIVVAAASVYKGRK
jgi:ribose transport system permease protein